MPMILKNQRFRPTSEKQSDACKRTVLIISRFEERIKTINQKIYSLGYSCVKEHNCEQAIETLKILKFSVIFIDMDIPREEALKMIVWLEEFQPDVFVFFINTDGKCHEFYGGKKQSLSSISYSERMLNEIL